ncbi:leucine-rich repeat domain-containing protein [Duncaniella muris]|uniref:leucine-rich repeat domain-containing protein n=2 Tax=Duncaniella muris TaxID=2094150 RepID=UPI0025A580EA|nr:leucine-rich repeat domain-containing protein [Duncaniella muris]
MISGIRQEQYQHYQQKINKMKRLLLLLCGLMSLVMSVHAADQDEFTYRHKGHTLNYLVLSESKRTCAVIGSTSGPVGALELPDFPVKNGIEYTLVEIADYAFYYCRGLTSVEIPNSVKTIGDRAFYMCTGLTSVVIGNSVMSIGYEAFADCSGLKKSAYPDNIPNPFSTGIAFAYSAQGTTIEDGVIFDRAKTTIYFAPVTLSGEYTIPESVTSIDQYAFYYCTKLTSVVIGNSVMSIGYSAFANCSGLKKSAYPDNIPNPFSYGRAIAYSAQETTIEDGVIFDQAKTTLYFAPATLAGEYTVPSTVKTIADNAFSYCEDITYVRMPATLSSIGKNAFLGCRLYDFTIPNAVKSFDMATLSGNPLKSLTVGSGVTQISGAAYFLNGIEKIFWLGNNPPEGCYSFNNTIVNFVSNDQYEFGNQILYPFLSSMFDVEGIVYVPVSPSERTCNVVDYFYAPSNAVFSVPPTVTNKGIQLKVIDVGAYAFYHHDYLTDITLDNNGIIDDYAFYNCIKLQSVTFGNNIPEIKNHTFENCEVLKKVENSPALISIGEWAFSGCVGMEYFSVGDKATSFGEEAFSDCTGLTEFYSYAATPPVCGKQALDDIIKWNCKLYVPIGSETLYASAPQWKDFFYIDGVESGIDTIFIDPQNNNIEIFDINGIKLTTRLEDLPAGIYIVRQGKNVKKIAVK